MTVQKREYFRIQYPDQERAKLLLNSMTFSILDLSQSGVKFLSPSPLPHSDQIFMVKIIMLYGYQHLTRGRVVRTTKNEVMMVMEGQIEKTHIDAEEEYLFHKYGLFKSAPAY